MFNAGGATSGNHLILAYEPRGCSWKCPSSSWYNSKKPNRWNEAAKWHTKKKDWERRKDTEESI